MSVHHEQVPYGQVSTVIPTSGWAEFYLFAAGARAYTREQQMQAARRKWAAQGDIRQAMAEEASLSEELLEHDTMDLFPPDIGRYQVRGSPYYDWSDPGAGPQMRAAAEDRRTHHPS